MNKDSFLEIKRINETKKQSRRLKICRTSLGSPVLGLRRNHIYAREISSYITITL